VESPPSGPGTHPDDKRGDNSPSPVVLGNPPSNVVGNYELR
jgi:hypothetical protein